MLGGGIEHDVVMSRKVIAREELVRKVGDLPHFGRGRGGIRKHRRLHREAKKTGHVDVKLLTRYVEGVDSQLTNGVVCLMHHPPCFSSLEQWTARIGCMGVLHVRAANCVISMIYFLATPDSPNLCLD